MTEEQLMYEVTLGDLEKSSKLFELYHKRIYNFFLRLCFDRHAAEDMTQTVFVRMIHYRSSYKRGKAFRSWIYQIARNVFNDHIQKKNKMRTDELQDFNIPVHNTEPNEQVAILNRALQQLEDEERQLIILSKYENMKYAEIAEVYNTSVANIKVKVHRTIQKLKQYYFQIEKL